MTGAAQCAILAKREEIESRMSEGELIALARDYFERGNARPLHDFAGWRDDNAEGRRLMAVARVRRDAKFWAKFSAKQVAA